MRTIIAKVSALLGLVVVASMAFSQNVKPGGMFGVNIYYAQPQGHFAERQQFGGGAEVMGGIGFGKTYFIASIGAAAFKPTDKSATGTLTTVPFKVGVRQFFLGKKLFVQADAGMATIKDKVNGSHSQFIRGIGAGARLLGFEAGVYYDGFKQVNTSGFANSLQWKVGYGILL